MKNINVFGSIAAAILAFFAVSANAASGSYSNSVPGATVYAPNTFYTTTIPVLGSPTPNSRAKSVYYSYGLGAIPSGGTLEAYLCHGTTSNCVNVSSSRSGSTTAFATDNRSATIPFFFYYRIVRSSSFPAVFGVTAQVIVNWAD